MYPFVMQAGSADDQLPHVAQPSAPPGDASEMLLTMCSDEVHVAMHLVINTTGLDVVVVLQALVIIACQPKTTPQPPHESSGRCRDSPLSPSVGLRPIPLLRG
jgi:hypothetical protein